MDPDSDDECVAVDVRMPAGLLSDLDAYAATRGYQSPDAAVSEALARRN